MRTGYFVLFLALVVALWRSAPPLPAGVDAPASAFSAARAYTDVYAIAQKPHPVGSPEHERVKNYIVGRMTEMGLSPRLQTMCSEVAFNGRTVSAPVANIIGTLKGKDPNKPAVVVMSHYDSVPDSPGAGDDTAGVATALEIARAMKATGTPEHDVIFLVTDGEELGLLGAAAFFHHDPLAAHAGAVINFETRGDSGLANMFETGPNNGEAVAMYAAHAPRPAANSLSRVFYKRMPNGTDLSVALEKGLPALNVAFIGDEAAYHSALATPAHLNLGSVQQMGDSALGAAHAFATHLPEQRADAVYSDVLGFFVVQYPLWAGWIVLGAAAVLALIGLVAAQAAQPGGWWRGIGGALLVFGVPAAALVGAGAAFGTTHHFLRLAHFDFLLAGAGALAAGLAIALAALFARRKIRPAAVWQVLLVVLLILGAAAQALVPEAAFVFVWPSLIAALMAVLRFAVLSGRDSALSVLICGVLALLQLAMTIAMAIALFTAVGVDMPAVILLPLLTGLPVFLLLPRSKPGAIVPAAMAIAGAGLFAYGALAGPTAAHPAPVTVRHVQDLDTGKAYRVAYLGGLDPWTENALGTAQHEALPWTNGRALLWAPAKPVTVPDTDVVLLHDGGKLRIAVQPRPGAWSVTVTVKSDAAPARAFKVYAPDRDGVSWTLPDAAKADVTVETLYPSWPKDAASLPPLPPERTAFGNHAATETVKRRSWAP